MANQRTWSILKSENYEVLVPTRDSDGHLTSATVKWADGMLGVLTVLVFNDEFEAVDSYKVTHIDTDSTPTVTKTLTQPTLTRDSEGTVTNKPELTIT